MLMVDGSKEFYKLPSKCQSFVTMLVLSCAEIEFGALTKYLDCGKRMRSRDQVQLLKLKSYQKNLENGENQRPARCGGKL